jgi:putative sterol carrier protein
MTNATAEFFNELGARGHDPALKKARGTLRFDITDDRKRAAHWLVTIDKGDVTVARAKADAHCVVRVDRTLFDGMARGEVHPVSAILRGSVGAEGDLGLFVLFQRLFPGAPKGES